MHWDIVIRIHYFINIAHCFLWLNIYRLLVQISFQHLYILEKYICIFIYYHFSFNCLRSSLMDVYGSQTLPCCRQSSWRRWKLKRRLGILLNMPVNPVRLANTQSYVSHVHFHDKYTGFSGVSHLSSCFPQSQILHYLHTLLLPPICSLRSPLSNK